jgi:hypothetical protein
MFGKTYKLVFGAFVILPPLSLSFISVSGLEEKRTEDEGTEFPILDSILIFSEFSPSLSLSNLSDDSSLPDRQIYFTVFTGAHCSARRRLSPPPVR